MCLPMMIPSQSILLILDHRALALDVADVWPGNHHQRGNTSSHVQHQRDLWEGMLAGVPISNASIVKGDTPACLGLYGIIELAEIKNMYATIKVPRNVTYKGSDGKHILIPVRGRTTSVSTPNSEASIHGSNHFQTDNNTNTKGRVRATSLSNPIVDVY